MCKKSISISGKVVTIFFSLYCSYETKGQKVLGCPVTVVNGNRDGDHLPKGKNHFFPPIIFIELREYTHQ